MSAVVNIVHYGFPDFDDIKANVSMVVYIDLNGLSDLPGFDVIQRQTSQ